MSYDFMNEQINYEKKFYSLKFKHNDCKPYKNSIF